MKKILLALLLGACAMSANAEKVTPMNPSVENVPYVENATEEQSLHVFKSEKANSPTVVFIHGGGWVIGDKDFRIYKFFQIEKTIQLLLDQGYTVASVNYRLSPNAVAPHHINDVKAALEFLRKNAKEYNIDPERIAVMGDSAGGNLAQLVGVQLGKSKIRGVVSYYGVSDIVHIKQDRIDYDSTRTKQCLSVREMISQAAGVEYKDFPEEMMIGVKYDDPEFANLATTVSPITQVSSETSPMILFHGDSDCVVPYSQSKRLHAKLTQAGVDSELIIVPNVDHAEPVFFADENIQKQVLAFLAKVFK